MKQLSRIFLGFWATAHVWAAAPPPAMPSFLSDLTFADPKVAAAIRLLASTTRALNLNGVMNGRLTTESGVAISTSDRSSQGTIYFTPYMGRRISLYNGSNWHLYDFTEPSLSLTGISADTNYDVFIYDNAGTITLELSSAWASPQGRTDDLGTQDGVLVKASDATRRYVGIVRGSASGVTEDSLTKRFVANFYNRTERALQKSYTNSHTYNGNFRIFDNVSTNRVEWVAADSHTFSVTARFTKQSDGNVCAGAIGINGETGAGSLADHRIAGEMTHSAGIGVPCYAGYSYAAALETTEADTTQTFIGFLMKGVVEQ